MQRLITLLLAWLLAVLPALAQDRDPVSMTPLSVEGRSLQTGIVAPKNGLASNLADIERGPQYAKTLNNLQMHKRRGIWTSKGIGYTKQRAGTFNSGAAFKDFATFVDSSGTQTLCFQVGSVLYSYNLSTSTETSIKTGLSTSALPTMRNFSPSTSTTQPILVYCNGDIEPRKVTSTSAEAALLFNSPGVWPGSFNSKTYSKPAYCEAFGDRMAYAGFSGSAVSFDVLISNQSDCEKFTQSAPIVATDAVAFTAPAQLGPIRGMRSLKLSNDSNQEVLIIGCANGMAVVTGDNATTFSMKILTRSHGIVSNRCWVQIDSNLYYLSTDGIRSFASLAANSNLLNSSLTYLIQDKINLIDWTNAKAAHATHHPRTQEVQWWLPLTGDSGQCKHALIMSYNNDESSGGSVLPVWSTKDGLEQACSVVFDGQYYHGTSDGYLCKDYDGDTYAGTAIVFDYVSPLISVGNPGQMASSRKVIVVADGQQQKFVIKPYVYSRLTSGETKRQSGSPASAILTAGISGGSVLGSWTLGSGAFPQDHVKTLDFQAGGHGIFWEYELTASASDHVLDLAALQFVLSGGGLQR